MSDAQQQFDKAAELEKSNSEQALTVYNTLIHKEGVDDKVKEQSIYRAGEILAKLGRAKEVSKLLVDIRPFFSSVSKARTAKIVRTLIDIVSKVPGTAPLQIELCKESIEWTKVEKRTFLRQRIETKLASLYHQTKDYQSALTLIAALLREVKKLDDKPLLVEIQLIESQVHFSLRNIPKAKASLTAARTAANSIYCPPPLQGEIEKLAGMLHSEEKDYKTAYSYFFEAFETFNSIDDNAGAANALIALKYMLLTKIMTGHPEDVQNVLTGKLALKYAGRDVDAMRLVANAYKNRSLKDFQETVKTYAAEISSDFFIQNHLQDLYETLLEQNLVRLIEPFTVVEIAHVAQLIGLPQPTVEKKLSQMILDKRFSGVLDQGSGQLFIYDEVPVTKTYSQGLETIANMSKVVDSLYEKIGLLRQ